MAIPIRTILVLLVVVGRSALCSAQIDLGDARAYGIYGRLSVTNTGPTVINGDVGTGGTSLTGFYPPGIVNGRMVTGDATTTAFLNATAAYTRITASSTATDLTGSDLGGLTLTPGTYKFDSTAQLTGTLTLNGAGSPDGEWYFQIGSALTTATASSVIFSGGGNPCRVYWAVGSSATLGTGTSFAGNILASASVTFDTGAVLIGRAFGLSATVTLDSNVVSAPNCSVPSSSSSMMLESPTLPVLDSTSLTLLSTTSIISTSIFPVFSSQSPDSPGLTTDIASTTSTRFSSSSTSTHVVQPGTSFTTSNQPPIPTLSSVPTPESTTTTTTTQSSSVSNSNSTTRISFSIFPSISSILSTSLVQSSISSTPSTSLGQISNLTSISSPTISLLNTSTLGSIPTPESTTIIQSTSVLNYNSTIQISSLIFPSISSILSTSLRQSSNLTSISSPTISLLNTSTLSSIPAPESTTIIQSTSVSNSNLTTQISSSIIPSISSILSTSLRQSSISSTPSTSLGQISNLTSISSPTISLLNTSTLSSILTPQSTTIIRTSSISFIQSSSVSNSNSTTQISSSIFPSISSILSTSLRQSSNLTSISISLLNTPTLSSIPTPESTTTIPTSSISFIQFSSVSNSNSSTQISSSIVPSIFSILSTLRQNSNLTTMSSLTTSLLNITTAHLSTSSIRRVKGESSSLGSTTGDVSTFVFPTFPTSLNYTISKSIRQSTETSVEVSMILHSTGSSSSPCITSPTSATSQPIGINSTKDSIPPAMPSEAIITVTVKTISTLNSCPQKASCTGQTSIWTGTEGPLPCSAHTTCTCVLPGGGPTLPTKDTVITVVSTLTSCPYKETCTGQISTWTGTGGPLPCSASSACSCFLPGGTQTLTSCPTSANCTGQTTQWTGSEGPTACAAGVTCNWVLPSRSKSGEPSHGASKHTGPASKSALPTAAAANQDDATTMEKLASKDSASKADTINLVTPAAAGAASVGSPFSLILFRIALAFLALF